MVNHILFNKIFRKGLFVLIILLLWQASASFNMYNKILLPPPTEIADSFIKLAFSTLLSDIAMSMKRMLVGFSVAVLLGVALSILFVLFKGLSEYISLLVEIIRPIPPIAWIPIAILWFGIGDKPAYFIVMLGSFFPVFVNCFVGINQVEKKFLVIAQSFGAGRNQIIREIYFPLVFPYLVAGMRIGLGVGWMSVITAELIGAQSGLGYMMQLNRVLLQTQNVMVGMLTVGILGFVMNKLMLMIEASATPWKEREQIN